MRLWGVSKLWKGRWGVQKDANDERLDKVIRFQFHFNLHNTNSNQFQNNSIQSLKFQTSNYHKVFDIF